MTCAQLLRYKLAVSGSCSRSLYNHVDRFDRHNFPFPVGSFVSLVGLRSDDLRVRNLCLVLGVSNSAAICLQDHCLQSLAISRATTGSGSAAQRDSRNYRLRCTRKGGEAMIACTARMSNWVPAGFLLYCCLLYLMFTDCLQFVLDHQTHLDTGGTMVHQHYYLLLRSQRFSF